MAAALFLCSHANAQTARLSYSARAALPQVDLRFEQGASPNVFRASGPGYGAAIGASGYKLFMGTASVSVSIEHADADAHGHGEGPLAGRTAYFKGSNPARWRTAVPSFRQVRYSRVLPGVDVAYHSVHGQLEFDFVLDPGVDPDSIRMRFAGQDSLKIDDDGNLVATAAGAVFVHKAPTVYQRDGDTLRLVAGEYSVKPGGRVGFELGLFDRSKPLIIDPVVSYTGFLSGNGADKAMAVIRGADGMVYVSGTTGSNNLTVSDNALQSVRAGDIDLFLMKIDPTAPPDSAVLYTTYIGGSAAEDFGAMAVDGTGHVYLTGTTASTDFPLSSTRQQAASGGDKDAFVLKLDLSDTANPAVVYSTYLGGSGPEAAYALTIDSNGNAYVAGYTGSTDFPVAGAAFQTGSGGGWDGFVSIYDASGILTYSTYIGGDKTDSARAIALASDGSVVVALDTTSASVPWAGQSYSQTYSSGGDIFIAKFSPNDSSGFSYGSYFGGSGLDQTAKIAFDAKGRLLLLGSTQSTNLPITPNALQKQRGGGTDAFLAVFDLTQGGAAGLLYSTYLGGGNSEVPYWLTFDGSGAALIAGYTTSTDFPATASAWQTKSAGLTDGFVAKVDYAGTGALTYSTYVGGAQNDYVYSVDVDQAGNLYLAGTTSSKRFPASASSDRDGYYPGDFDAFVLVFQPCGVTLSPASNQFTADAGTANFLVSTGPECSWAAASSADWITVADGASGKGNGQVAYSVARNGSSTARSGAIGVSGQSYSVRQAGADCAVSIGMPVIVVDAAGGSVQVPVNASPADCAWTSAASNAWVTVASGGSGLGSGSVALKVDAYDGTAPRESAVVVAGQPVLLVQLGSASNVVRMDPPVVTLTAVQGSSDPIVMTVNLTSGSAPLTYTAQVAAGGAWLAAAPLSGTTPAQLKVTVTPASLGAGSYLARIAIKANGDPDLEQSIPVVLTVTPR